MRRLALGRQVGGRGHHHAPHLPDLMRDERGIVEPADAHAQIYALFQQIHLAVRQHQAAAHLVVLPDKAIQRRRHVHLAEQHRRRDRQLAGEFPGVFAQRRFGLFQGRQHMAAAIQVAQASLVSAMRRVLRLNSRTPRSASSAASVRTTVGRTRPIPARRRSGCPVPRYIRMPPCFQLVHQKLPKFRKSEIRDAPFIPGDHGCIPV